MDLCVICIQYICLWTDGNSLHYKIHTCTEHTNLITAAPGSVRRHHVSCWIIKHVSCFQWMLDVLGLYGSLSRNSKIQLFHNGRIASKWIVWRWTKKQSLSINAASQHRDSSLRRKEIICRKLRKCVGVFSSLLKLPPFFYTCMHQNEIVNMLQIQ